MISSWTEGFGGVEPSLANDKFLRNDFRRERGLMVNSSRALMPVEEVRRQNLRRLVKESAGTQANFAKTLPFGAARLSQLIAPGSNIRFTEDVAREIEVALGLQPRSMDRAAGAKASPAAYTVEQGVQIQQAIMAVVVKEGRLLDIDDMREITDMALANAHRTGMVDAELVASLTRSKIKKR